MPAFARLSLLAHATLAALYLSTPAHANVLATYTDANTGMKWSKVSSLDEGQTLGLREATVSEFNALFANHSGWTYDAAKGTYNGTGILEYSGQLRGFLKAGSFDVDSSINGGCSNGQVGSSCGNSSSTSWHTTSLAGLDGGSGDLIGVYDEYGATYSGMPTFNGAASAQTIAALLAETTVTGVQTGPQVALNAYALSGGGYKLPAYYMVQAPAPEASSFVLTGLGLALVAWATRKRDRAPKRNPN